MTLPARSHAAAGAPLHRAPTATPVQGPEPQLATLFRCHAAYVATIGFRLLGRDSELDDLVQDVFIEAHRGLHRLYSLDAAKAWLARITVRRAVRRLRRRKMWAFFSLDAIPDHTALIDVAATPEERAQVASTYRLLDRLPVAHRIAWVLKHIEGETLASIAELTGCSKATVQRRLRAAQTFLGGDGHD